MMRNGLGWLERGVPIAGFPEGTRARDGVLAGFKGGMVALGLKAGVPLVPVTFVGTYECFPSNVLMPTHPADMRIVVHEPIVPGEGEGEADVTARVRAAIQSALPEWQRGGNE